MWNQHFICMVSDGNCLHGKHKKSSLNYAEYNNMSHVNLGEGMYNEMDVLG